MFRIANVLNVNDMSVKKKPDVLNIWVFSTNSPSKHLERKRIFLLKKSIFKWFFGVFFTLNFIVL